MRMDPQFVPNKKMLIGSSLFALSLILFGAVLVLKFVGFFVPTSVSSVMGNIGTSTAIMIGAGDIASCDSAGTLATSKLLHENADVIFTLGDNVYQEGTNRYEECFAPTWGKFKTKIRPALGNHDYEVKGAADYYAYFGEAAGPKGLGYYSYDVGTWHVIVLDSDCAEVGGCGADSPQGKWLKADLEENDGECTLAYWHHPLFNSGEHSSEADVKPFWDMLYAEGAELILNGHAHNYERFAPQTPEGEYDPDKGIREIIGETGGRSLYEVEKLIKNSEVINTKSYGVLRLELGDEGYRWRFVPEEGKTFSDFGSGVCR